MHRLLTLIALLAVAGLLAGCEDFDTLVNDPNRPTQANPALLLTQIEVEAFEQVSLSAALASRHLVFTDGAPASQYYSWQRADYGPYDPLRWIEKMREEAARTGNANYEALAHFFRAWYFYQLTQTFGDVPYSDALGGDGENFTPTYDSQEAIYAGILQELEDANASLDPAGGELLGDVIYDGDIRQWKKLINAFRLRVLMSLSRRADGPIDVAGQFQTIVNNPAQYPIMASNEDNAALVFHDRDGNRYPEYNNRSLQTAYFMAESFVERLKTLQDPRLFALAEPDRKSTEQGTPGYETDFASYTGLDAGVSAGENAQRAANQGEGSRIADRYHSAPVNEPSIALGYAELEFLLAEAAQRGWIAADAATHYASGVRASLAFYGIGDDEATAYLQQPEVAYDPAQGIEQISEQKHIAFFLNSGWEAFYNQRRTGFPTFRVGPATQNGGAVPKRWMYPQSELDNNRANVTDAIERQYGSDTVNGVMWSLRE